MGLPGRSFPARRRYQPRPSSSVFGRRSGQARALEFPRHGTGTREHPPSGPGREGPQELLDAADETTPDVVVAVRRVVPVALGGADVLGFIVPGAAAQHTIAAPTGPRLGNQAGRGSLPCAEQASDLIQRLGREFVAVSGKALEVEAPPHVQPERVEDRIRLVEPRRPLAAPPSVGLN